MDDVNKEGHRCKNSKHWSAQNKMYHIWKADGHTKRHVLRVAVETILLHSSECWKLTSEMDKKLDGGYKRLLRAA